MSTFSPIDWFHSTKYQNFFTDILQNVVDKINQVPPIYPNLSVFFTANLEDMEIFFYDNMGSTQKPPDDEISNHILTTLFFKRYIIQYISRGIPGFSKEWLKTKPTENKYSELNALGFVCYNSYSPPVDFFTGQTSLFQVSDISTEIVPGILTNLLLQKKTGFANVLNNIIIPLAIGEINVFTDEFLNSETKRYISDMINDRQKVYRVFNTIAYILSCSSILYEQIFADIFQKKVILDGPVNSFVDNFSPTPRYIDLLVFSSIFIKTYIPDVPDGYVCPKTDNTLTGCNFFDKYYFQFKDLLNFVEKQFKTVIKKEVEPTVFYEKSAFSFIFQNMVYHDFLEQKTDNYDYVIGALFGKKEVTHIFYDENILGPNTTGVFASFRDSLILDILQFLAQIRNNFSSQSDWNRFRLYFSASMRKSFLSYYNINSSNDLVIWFGRTESKIDLFLLDNMYQTLFVDTPSFFTQENMSNLFFQCSSLDNSCKLLNFDCTKLNPEACFVNTPDCKGLCSAIPNPVTHASSMNYTRVTKPTSKVWLWILAILVIVAVVMLFVNFFKGKKL